MGSYELDSLLYELYPVERNSHLITSSSVLEKLLKSVSVAAATAEGSWGALNRVDCCWRAGSHLLVDGSSEGNGEEMLTLW